LNRGCSQPRFNPIIPRSIPSLSTLKTRDESLPVRRSLLQHARLGNRDHGCTAFDARSNARTVQERQLRLSESSEISATSSKFIVFSSFPHRFLKVEN
jgi:hypothetical protein